MVEEQIEERLPAADFVADEVRLSHYQMTDRNDREFHIGGERIELPGAPVYYTIKKSPDGEWHFNKLVSAHGRRGADARELAAELHLPLQTSTGSLAVPVEVPFSEISKWRKQEVRIEVLVPEGARLQLSERVVDRGMMRVDKHPNGPQLYQMSSSGQLICQTCPAETEASEESSSTDDAETQEMPSSFKDYNSISISGPMKVTIEHGDAYEMEVAGP